MFYFNHFVTISCTQRFSQITILSQCISLCGQHWTFNKKMFKVTKSTPSKNLRDKIE